MPLFQLSAGVRVRVQSQKQSVSLKLKPPWARNAPRALAFVYSLPKFCLTESMKRSEAARYARWSASVACLLAMLTAGVYVHRKWVAHREKEKAPAPPPVGVARQESGLTFSKDVGTQRLFTVEASK